MAYLDIDFTFPIAILAASIIGVAAVRYAAQLGRRRAKARTERLLREYGGMSGADRASVE